MKNNILILALVAGLLALGFLYMKEKSEPEVLDNNVVETNTGNQNNSIGSSNNSPVTSNPVIPISTNPNWSSVSSLSAYTLATSDGIYLSSASGVRLSESVDLNGDGIDEGVFSGDGGNSGVTFILMKDDDGQSVAAKQKNKDGTISSVNLSSVGRAMFSESFKLIPEQKGFYTVSKSNDGQGGNFECDLNSVNAYSWNASTKLFEWNQSLTAKYINQEC